MRCASGTYEHFNIALTTMDEACDRELHLKVRAQAAAQMKAKGVTITEPDREAFRSREFDPPY